MSARPVFSESPRAQEAPAPAEHTIGDLAREFGVTLRTLRFYEHRGLLNPRRQGMARFYNEAEKNRLALILRGKRLGFTLTEIRAMLAANDRGEDGLAMSRQQMKTQLDHLRAERARLDAGIAELEAKIGRG